MKERAKELTGMTVTRLETLHPCFDFCKVPTDSLSVVFVVVAVVVAAVVLFVLLLLLLFTEFAIPFFI